MALPCAVVLTVVVPAGGAGESTEQDAARASDEAEAGRATPAVKKHVRESRQARIEEALAELIPEAEGLGKFQGGKVIPYFKRPHAALGALEPDMANEVAERMLRPFAGNVYEDTFVRWHLMHVVKSASPADRRHLGPTLVKLVKKMPGPLEISERPEWKWVPLHIGRRWYDIYTSLRVVIGYPPYQDRINPPASFEYMSTAQRIKAEPRWKEALELHKQFETVTEHESIAFNQRIQEVNWIVRQYRGELIYMMFWTGDPKMAELLVSEIGKQARFQNGIALDLVSFWYLAAFDGALEIYEPALLHELSRDLEQIARNHNRWFEYKLRQRNLADYSFHLIQMLRDTTITPKVDEG